jgi:hypothetical protein
MEEWTRKFALLELSLSFFPECDSQAWRSQLERFKGAIYCYTKDKYFDMPGYTWREVNPWRYFLLLVPEGFCLIEHVLKNHKRWPPGQVNAAFGLASSMSHSSNEVLADKAKSIFQLLLKDIGKPTSCDSYQEYIFYHQYYYSLAQVDGKHSDACITFMHKNGLSDDRWELCVNQEYYESTNDSKTYQALQNKLFKCKKPFDINKYLPPVNQFLFEIVQKDGLGLDDFRYSNLLENRIISVKEF